MALIHSRLNQFGSTSQFVVSEIGTSTGYASNWITENNKATSWIWVRCDYRPYRNKQACCNTEANRSSQFSRCRFIILCESIVTKLFIVERSAFKTQRTACDGVMLRSDSFSFCFAKGNSPFAPPPNVPNGHNTNLMHCQCRTANHTPLCVHR